MIPVLRITLTIFLQLIICHSGVSSLKVELSPKKPLFRVGDRQELRCQVTQCSDKMTFSWSSLEDKPLYAEIQSSSSASTLLFKNVNKNHENRIRCTATCKGTTKQASATVKVYSFAKDPVISGHNSLVSGKKSTLTCEVSDVYPAERMTLEWVRGGEVVQKQEGEYGKESIQSYYTFTPGITNNGESITCRATLSLEDLPQTESTRETTESMTVLCPPANTSISVSPINPKENEFLSISCVSDSSPVAHMVLSKVLDGKETELVSGDGPQVSVSYREANISHTGFYICTTTNPCGRQTHNVTVTVAGRAPLISLSERVPSRPRNVSPLKVELSPKKPVFRVGDVNQELTCRVTPCSDEMTFSWSSLEDKPLYAEIQSSPSASTLLFKNVHKNHENTIRCTATCKVTTKQASATVKVYSFAKDPVISGHNSLVSGKESTLTCEVSDVYPAEHMTLEWVRGGEVVQKQEGEYGKESIQSYYTFTPEITNNGESITCRATLSLEDLPQTESTRETTESMTVLCPPANTLISVSPINPKENEFLSISCVSDSSPVAHMVLSKVLNGKETELVSGDGPQVSVSYREANLSHTGFYICTTTNPCGRQTHNVTVTVAAPPRNITVAVHPSKEVQEGENITICCQSVSFPPSNITLRKLINGNEIYSSNGTFQLVNLTSNDSGLYQIIATNVLGSETENFTLNVKSKRKNHKEIYKGLFEKLTSTDFILPAIGVGILASVISSLGLIRKAKMKGAYELSEIKAELP